MRTAKQHLINSGFDFHIQNGWQELIIQAINEARKECIRECADRFQIEEDSCYNNYITEESINSIINGLK